MNILPELKTKFDSIKQKLDFVQNLERLTELEKKSQQANLWDNPASAQELLQSISDLQKTISQINSVASQIKTIEEFSDLLTQTPDPSLESEVDHLIKQLETDISALELQTYLSGKYDQKSAILSIHSGQGGTEAMDWTAIFE